MSLVIAKSVDVYFYLNDEISGGYIYNIGIIYSYTYYK